MLRVVLFTASYSSVLDYLLSGQNLYGVLLVDFSIGTDLETIAKKSGVGFVKFSSWADISKYILDTDLIVSYRLPRIVPESIVQLTRYGAFNIHPSLLPYYKGLNPWYDMYYDGELNSGVTIHRMSSIPDEGAIMMQRNLTIEFGEPLPMATKRSERIATDMLREFLDDMIYMTSGKFQTSDNSRRNKRTLDSIRQLPVRQMWHLFRGFPSLLKKVFPELPHEYFEVGVFSEGKNNTDAHVSHDLSCIEIGDGMISLIDFSQQPMASDYIRAIESGSFKIDDTEAVEFERNVRGELVYAQGTEAIVFFANVGGERKTIRFRKDLTKAICPDYVRRMQSIGKFLEEKHISHFVRFNVVQDAVETDKGHLPALVMTYKQGTKLSEYLRDNIRYSGKLVRLAHEFEHICQINNSMGIVHGDLSDNNLLVDGDGHITILDVDHIWIKCFLEQKDCGADKAFQHPMRKNSTIMRPYLDYFSQLVIMANILVAIEQPGTYLKYCINGNIFTESDYAYPQSSVVLSEIRKHESLCNVSTAITEALSVNELSLIKPLNITVGNGI